MQIQNDEHLFTEPLHVTKSRYLHAELFRWNNEFNESWKKDLLPLPPIVPQGLLGLTGASGNTYPFTNWLSIQYSAPPKF